jgi:tRNA(Ile)-lysidine synthetase-like protein
MEGLPLALRRRAVVRQLIALGHEPTHELVAHLSQRPGKARHVAGGRVVVAGGGAGGEVRRGLEAGRSGPDVRRRRPIRVPLKGDSGVVPLPGGRMEWGITTRRPDVRRARAERGQAWLDADAVGPRMRWRPWEAGDRFRPLGAPGRAKVGDLFTNRRVPVEERAGRWVAEATDGTLCWVEGWPCGEAFKVTPGTRRFLKIQVKRAKAAKGARASDG